jgi:phosphatidylserine decarboxylase
MRKLPVAPDAFPYMAVLLVLALALVHLNPWLSIIPLVLFVFIAYFFRNPPRKVAAAAGVILSPADGIVLDISRGRESEFFNGEVIRVSIFLSIFNVHINRCPIGGEVVYRRYRQGKFFPAFKSHASEVNERNYVGFVNEQFKVLVTQITGFLARRIVCWVNPGDAVRQGEIFGLIKFGSNTEIVFPGDLELLVRRGDKVRGGVTIIGRMPDGTEKLPA